jgi:hypothetical protein
MVLHSATTAESLDPSGQTESNLLIACGVGAATCTRSVQRRGTHLQHRHAATASWRKEKKLIPPTIRAADTRRNCVKESRREHPGLQLEECSLLISPPQVCPSRWCSETTKSKSSGHTHARLQWQVQRQCTQAFLHICSTDNNSQFRLLMYTVCLWTTC